MDIKTNFKLCNLDELKKLLKLAGEQVEQLDETLREIQEFKTHVELKS